MFGQKSTTKSNQNQQKRGWEQLKLISIQEAVMMWLSALPDDKKIPYTLTLNLLIEQEYLHASDSLQSFSILNLNGIVERIMRKEGVPEAKRKARATAFISFSKFLEQRSGGMITAVKKKS